MGAGKSIMAGMGRGGKKKNSSKDGDVAGGNEADDDDKMSHRSKKGSMFERLMSGEKDTDRKSSIKDSPDPKARSTSDMDWVTQGMVSARKKEEAKTEKEKNYKSPRKTMIGGALDNLKSMVTASFDSKDEPSTAKGHLETDTDGAHVRTKDSEEEEEEEDMVDQSKFHSLRGGIVNIKPRQKEEEEDNDESPSVSTLISPTNSQNHTPRGEDGERLSPGSERPKKSIRFQERTDLGGPQRFLVTVMEAAELRANSGKLYVRAVQGTTGQESRRHAIGDRLVQGIVKVWAGHVKIGEEFYFEVSDPDTYVYLQVRVEEGKGDTKKDVPIGKEIKVHCQTLKAEPLDDWHELGEDLGHLRLKCQRIQRTEDVDNEGDEQAILNALHKHAGEADVMLRLSVRVVQAIDVLPMDDGGTSDPYIKLECGQNKKRTKVVNKSLHPQWHEDFDFFFPPGSTIPAMDVEMWDRDASSRDDYMGKATVAIGGLMDWKPRMEWVALKDKDAVVGKVQLSMVMEKKTANSDAPLQDKICQWFALEEGMMGLWQHLPGGVGGKRMATGAVSGDDMPPATLRIGVLRAKDLLAADRGGTSDPYVRVHIADDVAHQKKTEVKQKTLNPTWMENFELHVASNNRAEGIAVEVFDKDMIGADDSLGKVIIPLDSLVPDKEYRQWYELDQTDGNVTNLGQVELQLVLIEIKNASGIKSGGSDPKAGGVQAQAHKRKDAVAVKGLRVLCVGGRGMPKMDSGPFGKCDPYLKMKMGDKTQQTKVIKRSLAPSWNENFNFDLPATGDASLLIECYDYDMVGDHDLIGKITIASREVHAKKSEWLRLVHAENPDFNAEVFLTIEPLFESAEEASARQAVEAQNESKEAMQSVLSINVQAARNLEAMDSNGTSDPYAVIQVGKEKKKTKVIKKELAPEWNEKFEIIVEDCNLPLQLQVYDKDFLNSDDIIGETMVPLAPLVGAKTAPKWYTIYRDSKITGEVLLSIKLPRPAGWVEESSESVAIGGLGPERTASSAGAGLPMEFHGNCCPYPVRVYVSATLPDMARERHILHESVFPELRRLCEGRGIFFVAVDIRIGMVEESPDTIQHCLDEMDKCSIYLCLLGEKYGTRVQDIGPLATRAWADQMVDKSMVEIEASHALIFEPERFYGRAFVYMRDPSYIDLLPGASRAEYIEEDAGYMLALEAFKKRVRGVEELPIVENYVEPEAVMKTVTRDLKKCINRMYPKSTRQRLLTVQRSCLLQYAREGVGHYFVDAETAVRLSNYIAFGERCVLNIVGPPGAGKTSLLRTFLNLFEARRAKNVFVFSHFDLGCAGVESAKGVLRRILFEMKKQFGFQVEVPTNYIQIKRTFLLWLRMATAKGKVCFIIDGADGFDEPNDGIGSFLDCIPRVLPLDLRIVLTMETGSRAYDSVTKRVSYCKTLTLGTLSTLARKTISASMVERLGKTMDALDPRIVQQAAARNPLHLRVANTCYLQTGLFLASATIESMISDTLDKLEADFYKENPGMVGRIFTCIARSRRGLTDHEIMGVAGLSRLRWSQFVSRCYDMLDSKSTLVNFHHPVLDEQVCERYMPSEEEKQRVSMMLANYYQDLPLSFRKAEEYPWLLCGNAQFWVQTAMPSEYRHIWKRLRDVVADIDTFLVLYCDEFVSDLHDDWHAMSGVYDLVEEYTASLNGYQSKSAMAGATERILPIWHLARCQSALASFFAASGRYEAATVMYKRAVESWNLSSGREVDAAEAALKLGEAFARWGQFEPAENAFKEAIGKLEEAKGMNHGDVGRAMFMAADAMRWQKKEFEALPFCLRALEVLDGSLTDDVKRDDPIFAKCAYTLGVLQEIDGQMKAAEKNYKISVKHFATSLGESHPDYCQALESLAGVLKSEGRLSEAAAAYQSLLPLKEEMSVLGGSLGDVTSTLNNLAAVFVQLNDLRAAEVMYRKTVRIREHQYGHSHATVARSIEMLANLLSDLGDVQDAAFLLQRALNIRERLYGKDHIETAATLVNLSTVQCRRGMYHSSRDLFKRWAKIFINSLGHSHPTSVWALHWLDMWPEGGAPGTRLSKRSITADSKVKEMSGGQLFVNVIKGRNLTAMDAGKSSDPFVVVQFGAEKRKTKVEKKTINPVWEEKMQFTFTTDDRKNSVLVFHCFDKDVLGDSDDMGRFAIRMADLPVWQAYRVWHPFENPEEFSGEIEVEIFISEDSPQPLPAVKPKFDYEGKTVLQQFEEKSFRDQQSAKKREEAVQNAKEQGYHKVARDKINRASEHAVAKEQRRQARIAAGLEFGSLSAGSEFDSEDEDALQLAEEKEDEDKKVGEDGDERATIADSNRLLGLDAGVKDMVEGAAMKRRNDMDQGSSALHLAVIMDNLEKVNRAIEEGSDLNVRDLDGLTALHYACGEGNLEAAQMLINGGADMEARDKEGDMPVHVACQEGHYEVLLMILTAQPHLLHISGAGRANLLHMAAASFEDRCEIISLLLDLGADVHVKDGQGKGVLEIAEEVEDQDPDHPNLKLLQERMGIEKAFVSAVEGAPLRRATAEKCYNALVSRDRRIMEKLLSGGMDVNGNMDEVLRERDDMGLTPVLLAIRLLHNDMVRMLASNEWGNPWGLSVTLANVHGIAPLHMLALSALEDTPAARDILEVLLEHNPDCAIRDRKGYTPLHYACQSGNLHLVQNLIERGGADLQDKTEDQRTALIVAAFHQRGDVMLYLLGMLRGTQAGNFTFVSNAEACKTIVSMSDSAGCTALHYAAFDDNNIEWVRIMLEAGGSPIQVNREGMSPLDVATKKSQALLMDVMSRHAAQMAKKEEEEASKRMLMLVYSIQDNDVQRLKDALWNDRTIVECVVDEVGDTLLHTAASLGRLACMDELLRAGAYVYKVNSLGCTPLHAAAIEGQFMACQWLLHHGADPRANDSDGFLPIHYAASEGHLKAFRVLVEEGLCDIGIPNFQGETVLHCAVSGSRAEIVKYILRRAPEMALKPDADGKRPVDHDMGDGERGRDPQIKEIMQAATECNMRKLTEMLGTEHLEHLNAPEIMATEVSEWERLRSDGYNAQDESTPRASEPTTEIADDDDATEPATPRDEGSAGGISQAMLVLRQAMTENNIARVRMMLGGGGAVDPNDVADKATRGTLFHHAASLGNIECMAELLAAGSSLDIVNGFGLTPLHVAALEGHTRVVAWILANNGDASKKDVEGYLPLHYASGEGHMDVLRLLVPVSDMGAQTALGLNALHMAVASHRVHVIQYLLRQKPALAGMPEAEGKLPEDYAKGAGYDDEEIWKQLRAARSGSSLLVKLSTDHPKLMDGV